VLRPGSPNPLAASLPLPGNLAAGIELNVLTKGSVVIAVTALVSAFRSRAQGRSLAVVTHEGIACLHFPPA